MKETRPSGILIDVSYVTLLKIIGMACLVYGIYELRYILLILLAACYMAISLEYLAQRIEKRFISITTARLIAALSFVLMICAAVVLIIPRLTEQLAGVAAALPDLSKALINNVPSQFGLRFTAQRMLDGKNLLEGKLGEVWSFGALLLEGVSSIILFVIFSIYLLFEGRRIFEWVLVFFSEENRRRIVKCRDQFDIVMRSYLIGQFITSVMAGIFAYVIAIVFNLPAPVLVATVAFFLDAIPIVGFAASTALSILLALTVSPGAAVSVAIAYCVYNLLENYLLMPKIYGAGMRMSSLVILLSLLVGAAFGGILGALIILPLVACYPTIEKVWFGRALGPDVINTHAAAVK